MQYLLIFAFFFVILEFGLFIDMRLLRLQPDDAKYFVYVGGIGMILSLLSVYVKDIKTFFNRKK